MTELDRDTLRAVTPLAFAFTVMFALAVWSSHCSPPRPDPAFVHQDTVSAVHWRAQAQDASRQLAIVRGEAEGLRGRVATLQSRLAGIEERKPARITVYDTVISLQRDTVVLRATLNPHGRLTLIGALPDSAGLHRPRTHHGIDVSDCDNGLDIIGTAVICNRPRLGHLDVYLSAGVSAPAHGLADGVRPSSEVGVKWYPSFRSTWAVQLSANVEGRAELRVQRGVRLW
jgi:hypothetical protein